MALWMPAFAGMTAFQPVATYGSAIAVGTAIRRQTARGFRHREIAGLNRQSTPE
jgi:hypothetical protein